MVLSYFGWRSSGSRSFNLNFDELFFAYTLVAIGLITIELLLIFLTIRKGRKPALALLIISVLFLPLGVFGSLFLFEFHFTGLILLIASVSGLMVAIWHRFLKDS